MKQCNVLLCIEPNHEGAHLLIDAPDHIKRRLMKGLSIKL